MIRVGREGGRKGRRRKRRRLRWDTNNKVGLGGPFSDTAMIVWVQIFYYSWLCLWLLKYLKYSFYCIFWLWLFCYYYCSTSPSQASEYIGNPVSHTRYVTLLHNGHQIPCNTLSKNVLAVDELAYLNTTIYIQLVIRFPQIDICMSFVSKAIVHGYDLHPGGAS